MDKKTRALVVDTMIQVLEQFAFVFAEEAAPDADPGWCDNACLITMTFSGPDDGTTTVILSRELCRTMAANALGVEADQVKSAEAEDTARELLNVFTGRLTFDLYGPKVVTELTVPELRPISRDECVEYCRHPDVVRMAAEGTALAVRLNFHGSR